MNRFIITEPSSCIGCRTCEVACTLAHQDDIVVRQESFMPRLGVVKYQQVTSTIQCRHCEDAPCVKVCPTNALVYRDNTVQMVAENCIGCKTCVIACPYGAMTMAAHLVEKSTLGGGTITTKQATAHKCDLCVTRSNGPACVEACPTKAIHLMTSESMNEMNREKRQRSTLDPAVR